MPLTPIRLLSVCSLVIMACGASHLAPNHGLEPKAGAVQRTSENNGVSKSKSGTASNGKSPGGVNVASMDVNAQGLATQERLECELIVRESTRKADAEARATQQCLERERIANAARLQLMNDAMTVRCVEQCIRPNPVPPVVRESCPVNHVKVNSDNSDNPLNNIANKRRTRTHGIFAYFWQDAWKQGTVNAALILDNGLAFVWNYMGRHNPDATKVFEVSAAVRQSLAGIVSRSAMYSSGRNAAQCGADAAPGYLYIATYGGGRRMANCSVGAVKETTNAGFYVLRDKLTKLFGFDGASELEGTPIDFDDMDQSIGEYLRQLPAGDARRTQVTAWLERITKVDKGIE